MAEQLNTSINDKLIGSQTEFVSGGPSGDYAQAVLQKYGATGQKTGQLSPYSGGVTPAFTVPTGDSAEKYPYYSPFVSSNEELYAGYQSWYSKAGHGILKSAGLASTTFLNGTIGLIAGVSSAIDTGKFSSFYDNDFSRALDNFNESMENKLPNYYTESERDASWYSPKNILTANFLFDKVIKNLGFSVGAIGAGMTYAGALRSIGLFSKVASAGGLARTAELTESAIETVPNMQRAAAVNSGIKKAAGEFLSGFSTLNTTQRLIASGLGTIGEAGFEALQEVNRYRGKLISEFVTTHGYEPTGDDLEQINNITDRAGNMLFGLNTILLTGTNYVQMPKILGSSFRAERALYTDAIRETEGIVLDRGIGRYVRDLPKTRLGRFATGAKYFGSLAFSPSEAFEELSQTSFNFGVENYYDKARKGQDTDFIDDALTHGYYQALTTKEGLESMLLGGLSGGIFELRNKIKTKGLTGTGGEIGVNTNAAVEAFNNHLFSGFVWDNLQSQKRAAVIGQERAEAISRGEILESRDLEYDYTHNYLAPRVKYGRFDLVKDDIEQYRTLGLTEQGLQQLKDQGIIAPDTTSEQFISRLDNFIRHADNVNQLYQSLNTRYAGLKNEEGKSVFDEQVIDKMVYAAGKVADYDYRIPALSSLVLSTGINIQPLLDSMAKSDKPAKAVIDNTFEQIEQLDILDDQKDQLKTDVRDLTELSSRRRHMLKEYEQLKKRPEDYIIQKFGQPDTAVTEPITISQRDQDGKVFSMPVDTEVSYPLAENIIRDKNTLHPFSSLTVHDRNILGELRITTPTGKTTFADPRVMDRYNLTTPYTNTEKISLTDLFNKAAGKVLLQSGLDEIQAGIPESFQEKIALSNSMDNTELTDKMETVLKEAIGDFEKIRKKINELVEKEKSEIIESGIAESEKSSGQQATESPLYDNEIIRSGDESAKKHIGIVFRSSTSEATDIRGTGENDDFHRRANRFLSIIDQLPDRENIRVIAVTRNNQKAAGLDGLIGEVVPGTDISADNIDEGVIRLVFIRSDKTGDHFIDSAGRNLGKVGSAVSFDSLIYTTLPNTSLLWRNGQTRYISSGPRAATEQTAKSYQQAWRIKRTSLLSKSDSYDSFPFSVSRGIPTYSEPSKASTVVGTLVSSEDLNSNIITIPTQKTGETNGRGYGNIIHNEETISMPLGRPVLQKGATLLALNNRKLTGNEKRIITGLLARVAQKLETGTWDRDAVNYLQSILFWKKPATDAKVSSNQIWTSGGYLYLGSRDRAVPLITEIVNTSPLLSDFLDQAYISVNNYLLTHRSTEPFNEITDIDDQGQVKLLQWKSYQHFLLDNTYSTTNDGQSNLSGSSRPVDSIPLTTDIVIPDENADKYSSPFEQRYTILNDFDLFPHVASTSSDKDVISDADYSSFVDKNQVSPTLLTSIALKVVEKVGLSPREEAILAARTTDINAIINDLYNRSSATPSPGESSTAPTDQSLLSITQAGDFILDGTTLNLIEYEGKKLAKVAASFNGRQIQFGQYEHLSKKEHSADKKAAVLEIATFQIAQALTEEITRRQQQLTTGIPSQPEASLSPQVESIPLPPPAPSNDEITAEQIFANLKPGNQSDISGGQFRKVSEGSEEVENIEEFEKYAERILPQVPRYYLKDLIRTTDGGYAWGMFLKGAIYLYENAALGTGYHEVFEAVYNMFLDNRQQKAIINEFKNTSGTYYDTTTGSDLSYEQASDHQAKEQIAEEFRQYVLSGILPTARMRKNFFQRIWDYIKRVIGLNPDSISSLFKKIDSGYYANMPAPAQTPSIPYFSMAAIGLNSTFIHQAMQGITAIVIEELFTTNGSLVNLEEQQISLESLYDKVFDRLQTYFMKSLPEQLLYDLQVNKHSEQEALNAKQIYAGFINNSWIPIKKNWRVLVALNKEFLRTLNIEFVTDDNETGDVISAITPNSNNREYERDILKISARKNASTAVKLLFATLSAVEQDSNSPIQQATLSTPARKLSSLKLPLLVNYASYFNRLLYQVAGNHQMKGLVENIKAIAIKDSTYVRLYNRLKLPAGYENLGLDEWKLLLKLYATTSKQQPDFLIGQRDETGKNYFIGANQNKQTRLVAREWITALRSSKMVSVQNNKYSINSQLLENMPIRTLEDKISFLEALGIKFNQVGYNDLSALNKKKFNEGASAIYSQLKKTGDIASLSGRWLGISGPLNKLAEAYVAMAGSTTEPQHLNISGETVQNLILHNYVSIITSDLNNATTRDELLEKSPHFSDVFSKDSILLENGGPLFDETGNRRDFPLSISIIEGITDTAQRRATPVTALSLSARRLVEFNQNLSGIYYTLVPADSRTEWGLNLNGYNYIGYGEFANKDALAAKIARIFTSYLTTEISLAAADRSHIKAVGKKSSALRFFKDILSESLLKSAGEVISGKNIADNWIIDNQTTFLNEVNNWIDRLTNSQVEHFLSRGLVLSDQNDKYRFPGLDSDFTEKHGIPNLLSKEQLLEIIKFRTLNYVIHNIELHKVFFGDPALYSDPTKRIKSFLSGREITYHTDREFDTFANTHLNRVRTEIKDISLKPSDPGFHHFRDYMPSVTIKDIMVVGSIAMDMTIDPKTRLAYANTNEADAQSWMRLTTYRELLHKAGGRWSDAMEKQFQYEMAYERVHRDKAGTYKYTNRSLKAADLLTIRAGNPSSATFEIIKPIGSGVKYGATFADMFLDKTSTVPLFYRMAESLGAEKIYLQAEKSDVGYIITESGRKVGAESLHNLYDEKGRMNESSFNNRINIPFKYFGIQQETASHSQGQPRGTQLTKIATMDLLQDSVPVDVADTYSYDQWHALSEDEKDEKSPIYSLVDKNRKILDALTDAGYRKVLSALDIKEENGNFSIKDFLKVVELLKDQVLSRDLPSDLRQALDTDAATGELKVPLEALTNYRSLRSIIYSVVDKYLLSPKLSGGPKVQVSSAMFEKNDRQAVYKPEGDKNAPWTEVKSYENLSDDEKATVRLSSSDLKFYSKDSPYIEVMLPAWFKSKLGANKTDEQILKYLKRNKSSLLSGIGFRIPTQALSSVERFVIKGFLPAEMGNTIMVPSEITVKAGSDFDIDKLNTYLRNFFIGKDGFPQSYEMVYRDTTTDQGLSDLFEIFNLNSGVTVSSQQYGIDQSSTRMINQIFGTELEAEQPADNLEDFMVLNRGKSIFDIYGRYQPAALENAYISTLEELISLPSNFERLIQPNSADELKELRDELNLALNKESSAASGDFAKLLDPMYLSEVRHNFLAGKDGVGIAALQQTNNALNQLTGVVLDHRDFTKKLTADQLPYVQEMTILLPHNSVTISGQKFISLSSVTDTIGRYISDKISAYINGYVDVAKDAFIVELGASLNVAATYLFLEKVGVPTRDVILFMNQPVIRQYLTALEINGFASPISARAGKIISQVKGAFPTSAGNITSINVEGLKSNIERHSAGGKFTNDQNREQQLILDEFLKYSVFADHLFKLAQGSNYDTANFSDPALIFRKVQQTLDVRQNNLFQGVDKILNGSFIGAMANRLTTLKVALGNIFVYDKPVVSAVLESVLKDYTSSGIYLSEKDYISIASRLQATFTDYLIQTYGKGNIGSKILSLFYGANAVADQFNGLKKTLPASSDLANNTILQSLAPIFDSVNPKGPKNLILKEKPFDGYSINRYTEAFRELRDNIHTASLYQNLLPLTLLQTGTRRAQGSFTEILPIEDYAPLLSDILGKLEQKSDLQNFKNNFVFQRSNWSEDTIVPLIEPKLLESREGSWYPLFAVPSMLFENLKIDSRSSSDFIQLHSWYQARELNFPVVKIRFVGIDPTTGEVFSREKQTEMRKNGDYSFFKFKLFQKVQEVGPDNKTMPLTYMDPEQRIPGSYYTIYKQINAWGKPGSIQEFYALPKPSVLETNLKITEFSDQDVISAFRSSGQTYRQTNSNEKLLPSRASAKTIKKIESFLENIGVDVKKVSRVVVNGKKLDVNAVANITGKLIQIVYGRTETALPEEAMHFAVELIEQTNPELFNKLIKEVGSYNLFKEIFGQYREIYTTGDNRPDIRKIKKEAVARILVETIINNSEGYTEKPELLSQTKSWWQSILDWFKHLFSKAKIDPFKLATEFVEKPDLHNKYNSSAYAASQVNIVNTSMKDELANIWNEENIIEKRDLGEFYYQLTGKQKQLSDKILNLHNQITKVTNLNNPSESHYEIAGKKIEHRVTNLAKKFYNEKFRHKQLSETELQKALNEQKRDKGTDGHADLEDIFHNLVDEDGYLRDIPLAQRLPSRLDSNDNSFYLTLEQHLKERLHGFPAGTRFFSEVMIYDRTKDEAGTIDFLAIEPDNADGTTGKIHILDWKFISLQNSSIDIPWYKKEAWNIQLSEYRRILSTSDYGASKSGFGQTRAIPIKATYTYVQGSNDKLKLQAIQIGSNNPHLITDDTLLPVPTATESTGNKQLDNLLTSLNSMVDKIYDTRSEPGKEYQKIDRLNDLVTAIRRLQLKMSTKDLFDFAKADIKSFNEFSKENLKLFDETSFSNLSTVELNRLSAKILDAEDVLSFYKDFGKIYRKIFDPFQEASKPLLREAEDISDGAEIVRDKLLDLAGKLRTNPIALGVNVVDLLQAEKAVTWYQKWVRSLSQGATKAVQILSSIINNINSRYRIDFSDEMEKLEKVKKDVEGWMKANGKSIKDLQRMFLGIDSKGNWNGKVISRTSQKYYSELEKAKIAKNKEWIDTNVDIDEYMKWYKQAYTDRVNSFATSRLNENDAKDKEIKEKRLDLFEKQFDILIHPDTAISQANLRLNSFPNLAIWSSEAYSELKKPGNEPVFKMYQYWEARLEQSYNLGIIGAWEKKTFFPNVRKDFLDKMVFGSRDATFKTANLNFLNDIRVDANDQVYGFTDINGNPQDKLSAWYVYDLGQKVTTSTGDEITDYSQKSTDIFKVMALWNAEMIKYQHKSEVVDIVRLIHYTEENRKAMARSKKTGGISYRADGEPVLIDNVENSAYFKNFMDFYFYGRKLSEGQDVTYTFHYNKLAQKVNGFFKADVMPASSEEEIVLSGKKTISAVNKFFQMKVLGINLATAVTNYLGGKTNAYMLAGKHFTKVDFTRASMQLAAAKFHTEEGKVYAGLLNYFLPLTDDRTREIVRDQSVSAAIRYLSSDHLFYLMRTSDKMVQYPVAIAFFDNTMVENNKLVNIREYVKAQKGYNNIYQLSAAEQKALRITIEEEIDNLKTTRSLPKIAKIQADKIVIDGIDRNSTSVAAFRNRIGQFSKDALGNMSEDDISQYRMTLLGQSFMMFKNWIPRMADVRFGEFRYQHGTESYEWGRISMLFNALKHGILTGATASLKTLLGSNDGLVDIARRVYEEKREQVIATGEAFNMSEAEFIDMYVKGIGTQLKEVGIMLGMVGMLMFAKAEVPDDDDRTKGFFKWLVRIIDKLTDELSFFMNPLSFTAIANGSVFPSVQVLTDIVILMRNLSFEGYYVAIGDEKAAENNKVLKYLYKTFPVSKELLMYTAIFNEEIAKEYGISITTNARKR